MQYFVTIPQAEKKGIETKKSEYPKKKKNNNNKRKNPMRFLYFKDKASQAIN